MTAQREPRVLKVALTGGIATGKSHVLDTLGKLGAPTIDADRLAREAVQPGRPALDEIRRRFGAEVLEPDGSLDRKKMAAIVFADAAARRDLEAIIHPWVYEAIRRWFEEQAGERTKKFAVADIPLLFETGHAADFDRVIVTACDPAEQLRRVMARDGLAVDEAERRIAGQGPVAEKVRRADFVISTDGSMEETERQVREVFVRLIGR